MYKRMNINYNGCNIVAFGFKLNQTYICKTAHFGTIQINESKINKIF